MDSAICNSNSKIWLFWNQDIECNILDHDDQQITCEIKHVSCPVTYLTTFVYAKCRDHLRRDLWDKMLQFYRLDSWWCSIGDFNVITDMEEKMGGQHYSMNKSFEFTSVTETCGLTDLGFHGQKFTWYNNRDNDAWIWKRLDRAMGNDKWLEVMPMSTVTHLASTGSDHCPQLLECVDRNTTTIKQFKFLHCWVDNTTFLNTAKNCWGRPIKGNPMRVFHWKIRRISNTVSNWSRQKYGDIFSTVKEWRKG